MRMSNDRGITWQWIHGNTDVCYHGTPPHMHTIHWKQKRSVLTLKTISWLARIESSETACASLSGRFSNTRNVSVIYRENIQNTKLGWNRLVSCHAIMFMCRPYLRRLYWRHLLHLGKHKKEPNMKRTTITHAFIKSSHAWMCFPVRRRTSFQPPPGEFDLILKDLDPVSRSRELLYPMCGAVLLCKPWAQIRQNHCTSPVTPLFQSYSVALTFNCSHNVLVETLAVVVESSLPLAVG